MAATIYRHREEVTFKARHFKGLQNILDIQTRSRCRRKWRWKRSSDYAANFKPFRGSTLLGRVPNNELTGSRDRVLRRFVTSENGAYHCTSEIMDHSHWITCIAQLPPGAHSSCPNGAIVTGCQDKISHIRFGRDLPWPFRACILRCLDE